jgi:hypothetical protein
MDTAHRAMLVSPLRELIEEARSERGRLPLDSTEREFYLGVDAAARGLLHPETLAARREDWLEHESHAFRDGYLNTLAEITAAVSNGRIPLRLPLPRYQRTT